MLTKSNSYAEMIRDFQWAIPTHYNIGADVSTKWALQGPERLALLLDEEDRRISFGELEALSNRLANRFADMGIEAGDRIGVLLPQCLETALAHIAAFKAGAISIPLAGLFGADALEHRLRDSGAKLLVTNAQGAKKCSALIEEGALALFNVDLESGPKGVLSGQEDRFASHPTKADDPALLIYTSGTTGPPKGALLPHRALLGHLPGVEMSHDFFPQADDVIWTPADWAWIGGLLDVLMPALHHGVPVVARRFEKFSGEAAFDLMRRRGVRNAFLPPTALKIMRGVDKPKPLQMRSVASGGESLGAELIGWGRTVFGVTINEFYGQTECNMVVSSASSIGLQKQGAMGWPVPGHTVAVIDQQGDILPAGIEGDIAVQRPDPVMFLGYWNNADASGEKFRGDWLLTGDRGVSGEDGSLRFVGRDDDVISSGGYRIGPGEIEDCLLKHPAVAMAGVVGKPDPMRGEIVVAFILPHPDAAADDALAGALAAFVKERLAAHEYPREVHFVDEMPLTTTGKIIRRALRMRLQNTPNR